MRESIKCFFDFIVSGDNGFFGEEGSVDVIGVLGRHDAGDFCGHKFAMIRMWLIKIVVVGLLIFFMILVLASIRFHNLYNRDDVNFFILFIGGILS